MKPLTQELHQTYPHGHPSFIPIVLEQVRLHSDKSHDYARGGDPLGNFKRVAAILSQWWPAVFGGEHGPAIVAFIFALKQVDAEAWSMKQGGECKVEGLKGRLQDQAVYANIRLCMDNDRSQRSSQSESTTGCAADASMVSTEPAPSAYYTKRKSGLDWR